MNQDWNTKAKECRDGRVAMIAGREHKEFDSTLHDLVLDHPRSLPKGPKVILQVMPLFALKTLQERVENPPYYSNGLREKLGQPEIIPMLRPLSKQHFEEVPEPTPSVYGLTYWFGGVASLEVFNTGVIESVDYGRESFIDAGKKILSLDDLYKECSTTVESFIWILRELGFLKELDDVESTIYIFLTLTDVTGIVLYAKPNLQFELLNGRVFEDQDCKAEADVYFHNGTAPSSGVSSRNMILGLSSCTFDPSSTLQH
ncbi:MAG: hypothetical protein WCG09_03275 [Halobacteriota archaeon]